MYEQTSMIGPQTAEAPAPAARYYEINEETARNAHYCVHMSDYKPGSATAEYRRAVDKAAALAKELGAKRCLPLKVSGPFHTPLMAPAGNALREYFQGVAFADPQIPVIFNCLGDVKDDSTPIQELLVKQVQSSVFMEDSIRKMADMGVDAIVEIGPGKALSGFVKKTVPGIPVCAVETAADVENLPDTLEQLIKEKA